MGGSSSGFVARPCFPRRPRRSFQEAPGGDAGQGERPNQLRGHSSFGRGDGLGLRGEERMRLAPCASCLLRNPPRSVRVICNIRRRLAVCDGTVRPTRDVDMVEQLAERSSVMEGGQAASGASNQQPTPVDGNGVAVQPQEHADLAAEESHELWNVGSVCNLAARTLLPVPTPYTQHFT